MLTHIQPFGCKFTEFAEGVIVFESVRDVIYEAAEARVNGVLDFRLTELHFGPSLSS